MALQVLQGQKISRSMNGMFETHSVGHRKVLFIRKEIGGCSAGRFISTTAAPATMAVCVSMGLYSLGFSLSFQFTTFPSVSPAAAMHLFSDFDIIVIYSHPKSLMIPREIKHLPKYTSHDPLKHKTEFELALNSIPLKKKKFF